MRKMGEEGVRLLEMREREIIEMRKHLLEMLKVMEQRSRTRASSHVLITRPSVVSKSEPHLKTTKSKPLKNVRGGKSSSHLMTSASSKSKFKRRGNNPSVISY